MKSILLICGPLKYFSLIRKNFALKEQLDEVILQMHAGGFREKWKDDMFDPKVLGQGIRVLIFKYLHNPDFHGGSRRRTEAHKS